MIEQTGGAKDEAVATVVVIVGVAAEDNSAVEGNTVAFLDEVVATVEAREADVGVILTPRDLAFL